MKTLNPFIHWLRMTAATLALISSALTARGDLVIDTFDGEASVTFWSATWGTAPQLSFSTENSAGAANSGALRVAADYFTAADNGWEQMVITHTFTAPVAGALYKSVSVDVKVDSSSTPTAAGQYGYFELKRPDGTALGGVNLTSTNWTTIKFDIAPTEGNLTGIIIQNGNGGFQGPVIYHLDNFKFNSPPAPKTVIDTFDEEATASFWSATWGTAPVLTWDKANAGGGAAGSGSLRVSADYFTAADNGWEQMVITRTFETPVVGSKHVSVSVDVKIDPSSVPTSAGQYGYFELKRADGSPLGGVNLTSTNWTTITFPLAATEGTLSSILIQNGNSGFQGPIIYYLDNFVFTQVSGGPLPPTLAIEKASSPGLKLFASAPGQAYQRQNIVYLPSEDLANSLWWVNQPEPITYSVTWADFPNSTDYAGFQGHIMLVTDTGGAITPDWNDGNVVMIEFQYANTAGTDGQNGTADDQMMARARFIHKVNEPAGNAMLYRTQANAASGPVGVLGELLAPSMLGTWSFSFRNNTSIVLTGPDKSTVTLTMPADDAALYEPVSKGVSAIFGVQPNSDTRVGLSAILSRIKIEKGNKVVVDETFQTAELDPATWALRAQDPGGLFTITPDLASLVSWNLPDDGFALNTGATVKGPWSAAGTTSLVGARRVVRVNKAALPAPVGGFFRLVK